MKTVKLGVCIALALVFTAGLFAPVQAGVLDAKWFTGKIQGESRLFTVNAITGEVTKTRFSAPMYFKLCSFDPIVDSQCGAGLGEQYLTVVAVIDVNDDGTIQAEEAFNLFFIQTCGATEQGFENDLDVDDTDLIEAGLQNVFGSTVGRVKVRNDLYRLRSNSGNGGGAISYDIDTTALFPDGVFRKFSWRANETAVEDLPEELVQQLITAGIIGVADDLLCPSEIVAVPAAD